MLELAVGFFCAVAFCPIETRVDGPIPQSCDFEPQANFETLCY